MISKPLHKPLSHAAFPTLLAVALADVVAPTPTHAQMALEEVIVVARKREESLQETPIAVTALNTDALRAAQVNNVSDLTREAPGLTRQEGRKTANLSIRGVGTRASGVNVEPGVGVYVDSIYIPRNDAQLVDVVNMESIQVLRGPQGTLFGKNTIGGAILLTTKKPDTQEIQGFIDAKVGSLDQQNLRFGISGPLIKDRFAAGIQVDYSKRDGYREDADTGIDYGDIDRQSTLAQFRVQTDELFTGDLMLFYGKVDENQEPANCQWVLPTALGGFVGPGNTTPFREECDRSWELLDDEEVLLDPSPLLFEIKNEMAGLTMAWDFDAFTLKSITGYLRQTDISTSRDVDGSSVFTINNLWQPRNQLIQNGIDADDQERQFVSQEFQFIGDAFDDFLGYTVGVFYSNEEIDDEGFGQMLGAGGFLGINLGNDRVSVFPPAAVGFREASLRSFENESAAVFGQAILDFSDNWQLTLGGRYTWEEKKVSQENYQSITPSPGVVTVEEFNALADVIQEVVPHPTNPNPRGKEDWTEFSPAVSLTYFTPESWEGDAFTGGMLYGSISQGFKAGGFAPFGQEFLPFEPEEVTTAEFGYKLDLWSSRARLNGAFYYSQYDDIQINVTRTIPNPDPSLPPTTLNGITNAGEATIYGAELEFSILPIEGLLLAFNASYINASYDEFDDEDADGNIIDRSDEDFAFIPEQTYSLTLQYDWMTGVGTFVPRLSGFYRDEIYIGLDPVSPTVPETTLDDYTVWNFRFAWQSNGWEGLEIAAFVNNLADEEYFGNGIASTEGVGALVLTPGVQRTYGVELYYSW